MVSENRKLYDNSYTFQINPENLILNLEILIFLDQRNSEKLDRGSDFYIQLYIA